MAMHHTQPADKQEVEVREEEEAAVDDTGLIYFGPPTTAVC